MIAPSRSNIEGHRRTFLILNFHRLLQHQHQLKVKCINKNRCNQGCENLQCQSSLGSFHAIRIIQTKSSSKPGTDVYNGKNVDVSVSLLGLILHSCCKTNFWNQILQAISILAAAHQIYHAGTNCVHPLLLSLLILSTSSTLMHAAAKFP